MPLRGFLNAFWTLIGFVVILIIAGLGLVSHSAYQWMEIHPRIMDVFNFSTIPFIIWVDNWKW